ncbi:pirin family protein [Teredinibacter franksiae]|jgi:Pirin-related protein|uniref:pirin family protein n=1 Tax=Teredinibacter franksiae TaxID=2761453 RepID=UPI0016299506|nr:pirin family protein [Teredinibacter franksiae]
MITKRDRNLRGPTDAGWLKSLHTFSFGQYHDPDQMGFGPLRVINDDRVVPSAGFQTHPHANMEIISYVLSGELSHKDSMGNGSTISQGEVQLMSAGSGITHSEFNASDSEEVHFLQIWIIPNCDNNPPEYHQKRFAPDDMHNQFRLVVSPNAENGSLPIKQDAKLSVGHFTAGQTLTVALDPKRKYWAHITRGDVMLAGIPGLEGDGFGIQNKLEVELIANQDSEILLFDLP